MSTPHPFPREDEVSPPEDPQSADRATASSPSTSDLTAVQMVSRAASAPLGPALAVLKEAGADRFEPVRFRYIEALTEKASKLRPSVAPLVEKTARQALSDFLDDYLPAREQAASLVARLSNETAEAADEIGRLFEQGDFKAMEQRMARTAGSGHKQPGRLAALTREILPPAGFEQGADEPSLENELRRQELEILRSLGNAGFGGRNESRRSQDPDGPSELSAMRHFRQSLRKRHSEQRVICAIQEGPENPGPLNAQALIIRTLSVMRDLSPSYTERFVAYMDTLLWLGQANGIGAPTKSKSPGRRGS